MSMPMACRKCHRVMLEVEDQHDNFSSVTVLPSNENRLGVDERGAYFWECQHCHHHNPVQKIRRPDGSEQLRFL